MPDNLDGDNDNGKKKMISDEVACLKFVKKDKCERHRSEFWKGLNHLEKEVLENTTNINHILLVQQEQKDRTEELLRQMARDHAKMTAAIVTIASGITTFLAYLMQTGGG